MEGKINIEKEILLYNYWEHFRVAKDLSLILNINNNKRIKIETTLNEINNKLNKINE